MLVGDEAEDPQEEQGDLTSNQNTGDTINLEIAESDFEKGNETRRIVVSDSKSSAARKYLELANTIPCLLHNTLVAISICSHVCDVSTAFEALQMGVKALLLGTSSMSINRTRWAKRVCLATNANPAYFLVDSVGALDHVFWESGTPTKMLRRPDALQAP